MNMYDGQTRRDFLGTVGAMAAAAALPGHVLPAAPSEPFKNEWAAPDGLLVLPDNTVWELQDFVLETTQSVYPMDGYMVGGCATGTLTVARMRGLDLPFPAMRALRCARDLVLVGYRHAECQDHMVYKLLRTKMSDCGVGVGTQSRVEVREARFVIGQVQYCPPVTQELVL